MDVTGQIGDRRVQMASEAETVDGIPIIHATCTDDWRSWLADSGRSETRAALVVWHQDVATPSVRYQDAIEHALCFGWIDSKAMRRDEDSFYLLFSPRNPKSTWSRVNRRRAQRMIERGLMTAAGQELIDHARRIGTWEVNADADNLVIPPDLETQLAGNPVARANFLAFPASSRRLILHWVATAKKPETRRRRVDQVVLLAAENIRANHANARARPTQAAGG
jgi:uncharacterized protein YdeI (YjbR/CyaY-like superfamily)